MTRSFESAPWLAAMAGLVREDTPDAAAEALSDLIGHTVDHEGTCLIAFHADAPPEVLHHTLEPEGARHYLDRYLAGPYLLDPLYELALREAKPRVCRFRDASPDRFRSSEYYRQYCERTHLKDEMDYLVDVASGSAVVLVVGRREQRFTRAELDRLERLADVVHAAVQKIWRHSNGRRRGQGDDSLHRRLTECFDNFGSSLLTEREQEIVKLLLRGHSTKSVARELDIAPGTVMVHKRNLFTKLGITSQYQLFSRFIDSLSG